MIIDIILKYWIEVFFGLIVSILGMAIRHFWKLWKSEQQHQKTEEQQAFYEGILTKIDERNEILENKIDSLSNKLIKAEEQNDILTEGLLSIQGSNFKRQCKKLLDENKQISEADWLQLNADYAAYEKLGGNGVGHELYEAVVRKYYNFSR